ncbi:endonuclease [Mycoplasma sp. Ms02]|uniref:endonuclease n=1 Tax=Mycoplasma sp. Ms02 TaxID=353851 RepID=UPI001C89F18A|nr:endonuclease [Mycoplasma sp. Ms02]QZE12251.1 endonuclease [Mycoplasma sp. Ms02]
MKKSVKKLFLLSSSFASIGAGVALISCSSSSKVETKKEEPKANIKSENIDIQPNVEEKNTSDYELTDLDKEYIELVKENREYIDFALEALGNSKQYLMFDDFQEVFDVVVKVWKNILDNPIKYLSKLPSETKTGLINQSKAYFKQLKFLNELEKNPEKKLEEFLSEQNSDEPLSENPEVSNRENEVQNDTSNQETSTQTETLNPEENNVKIESENYNESTTTEEGNVPTQPKTETPEENNVQNEPETVPSEPSNPESKPTEPESQPERVSNERVTEPATSEEDSNVEETDDIDESELPVKTKLKVLDAEKVEQEVRKTIQGKKYQTSRIYSVSQLDPHELGWGKITAIKLGEEYESDRLNYQINRKYNKKKKTETISKYFDLSWEVENSTVKVYLNLVYNGQKEKLFVIQYQDGITFGNESEEDFSLIDNGSSSTNESTISSSSTPTSSPAKPVVATTILDNSYLSKLQYDASDNYYESLQGLKGQELFEALNKLQSSKASNSNGKGYDSLKSFYSNSDAFKDNYFEKDGSLLDIYSENPSGKDPYVYSTYLPGRGAEESQGTNREHLIPQSWFNKAEPIKSDSLFVWPTDIKVNGLRGNLPHDDVQSVSKETLNHSKLGRNVNGDQVFEVLDAFKGDVARAYLYFLATYAKKSIRSGNSIFESSYPYMKKHYLNTYIRWSANDVPDKWSIDRNNISYKEYRPVRNPFIDYPDLASSIFGEDPKPFVNKGILVGISE